jgi:hypothetical protein
MANVATRIKLCFIAHVYLNITFAIEYAHFFFVSDVLLLSNILMCSLIE